LTRSGLALVLAALGGVTMIVFLQLALFGHGSRLDILLLTMASIAHIAGVLLWGAVPWAPRWIVTGYGLVLAASGFGLWLAAPAEAPAVLTMYGMVAGGAMTILAGVIHR
jgi:hypothetical protein